MDDKELKKAKNYLKMAMDCLDNYAGDDTDMPAADEGDSSDDSGDTGMQAMKLSLSKYK